MIARVKVDGNYLTTIDQNGKNITRSYRRGNFIGNSSEIVIVQNGNYIEVFDEKFKQLSRKPIKMDAFLGASGETFSIQIGNYAETYTAKGKKISRKVSKL